MNQIRFLLIVFFSGSAIIYVYQSIKKYSDRKVSLSTRRQSSGDTTDYPSVTICSGFRNDENPVSIARKFADDPNANSMELLGPDAIKSLSYDRNEFITYFTQTIDNNWDVNMLNDDQVWTEEFHEHYGGRCATFNPVNKTKPGQTNSIIFGIQWPPRTIWGCNGNETYNCRLHSAIFFHPFQGFIYNKGHEFLGKSLMYPTANRRNDFIIYKKQHHYLSKGFELCNEDYTVVGWKDCILEAFNLKAGCIFPWLKDRKKSDLPVCNVSQVNQRLASIEHHVWWDVDALVVQETGCLRPCKYDEYIFQKVENEPTYISSQWHVTRGADAVISFFFINTLTEVNEEYLTYDGFSLVGEIGGAFGLFLGWSLVTIFEESIAFLKGYSTNVVSGVRKR